MYKTDVLDYLSKKNIKPDKDQLKAIDGIDELLKVKKKGFFRFDDSSMTGVYIWGLPGRGKSSLMDACLNSYQGSKIRLHFHEFLKSFTSKLSSQDDLDSVVDKWLSPYQLICFDEFHVHDIGDTMLVLRFLQRVVKKKHKLILTSNYEPDGLQPDPLFHAHFMPAIDIIKDKFYIIPFTYEYDYRELNQTENKNKLFFSPVNNNEVMELLFVQDTSLVVKDSEILLSGRPFKIFAQGDNAICMKYEWLCLEASSYIDYLELTDRWKILFLSDIKEEYFSQRFSMQRFIWLLDVLYDRRITFFTTSEKPLIQMVKDSPAMKDIERTISRLNEMQFMNLK